MRRFLSLAVLFHACVTTHAQTDWPDFRGPTADGRATTAQLPLRWSETQNIKWKTPIPLKGWSSPVIMAGQIWLTTATPDGHDFYAIAVDAATGKILCDTNVFHCANPEPLGNDLNTYASPSPTLEAGRAYVHFGSYGTACLDTKTFDVIWKRDDLPCRHYRGPGSSPVLYRDLLILTMDGVDVQYVTALDKRTGKTVWKTDRSTVWTDIGPDGKPNRDGDQRKAFSTPLIIDAGGVPQMLSSGSMSAFSYDPLTGKELWKVRHAGFSPASRPLYANGLALFASGNGRGEMLAVRVDGHGDVTDTKIVWRANRASPRMPSPVLADGLLFMVNDSGIGCCLDAATGTEMWRERLGGEFAASPVYGAGRVYFCNRDGVTTVVNPARAFEPIATNQLASGILASPAVSGKALFLRTKTDLYRIEEAAAN